MKFVKNPLLAVMFGLVSAFLVSEVTNSSSDTDLPLEGLVFGLVTCPYIYILLRMKAKSVLSSLGISISWVFMSEVSWVVGLVSFFISDNYIFILPDEYSLALFGGFAGAAVLYFTLTRISKKSFNFKYMCRFSAIAASAAVVAVIVPDLFGVEMKTMLFVHILWQCAVLYLVHRYIFLNK